MDYKLFAEKQAEMYVTILRNFKYYAWNGKYFQESRPLPAWKAGIDSFRVERTKKDGEESFFQALLPYIAYLTAPTKIQAEDVLMLSYDESRKFLERKKKNVLNKVTDGYGFDKIVGIDLKLDHYDRWEYTFKKIAEAVAKELKM